MLNPYRHLSILGLIAVSVIVFAIEHHAGSSFAEGHGSLASVIVPAFRALISGEVSPANLQPLSRLVSSLFLHGDPQHLVYNMVFLWTFGYLASQFLGQWWALLVFVLCGICGNIVQISLNPDSTAPIIGASGAICGFQGVYLGLALRWQLPWPSVWPLAHAIPPLQLGAFAVLGFVGDVYFLANRGEGIAYGAHIGGFLFGLATAALVTTIYPTAAAFDRSGRNLR